MPPRGTWSLRLQGTSLCHSCSLESRLLRLTQRTFFVPFPHRSSSSLPPRVLKGVLLSTERVPCPFKRKKMPSLSSDVFFLAIRSNPSPLHPYPAKCSQLPRPSFFFPPLEFFPLMLWRGLSVLIHPGSSSLFWSKKRHLLPSPLLWTSGVSH